MIFKHFLSYTGTGKTVVGAKIAFWFAHLNRPTNISGTKQQVLYCAPTNNAVDVAASKALKTPFF